MWSEWTQKSLLYPEFRGQHGTASKNLGVKQSVLKSKARTELVESRSYWMIWWPATAEPGFLLLFSSCESCPEMLNASIKSDDRIHRFRCGKCCCRFKVSWLFWIVLDRYKLVWPHVCNFCSNSLPSSRALLVHQQLFGVLSQFCRSILPLENSNSVNRCESVVSVRLRGRLSDICFRLWVISTSIWTPFPPEQCLFWICPWTPSKHMRNGKGAYARVFFDDLRSGASPSASTDVLFTGWSSIWIVIVALPNKLEIVAG